MICGREVHLCVHIHLEHNWVPSIPIVNAITSIHRSWRFSLEDFHLLDSPRKLGMFGLINLYKPVGLTSRDCVNIVSKNLGTRKVGHAGTLDPIAQGVLVIAVGQATRLIEYVQRQRKTYRGQFMLGLSSPSCDTETDAAVVTPPSIPTVDEVKSACDRQVGRIEQVPPAYSAVKIDGHRAYDLARSGVEVVVPARIVDVFRCELVSYDYPAFELLIECGSGTYVRSIGRDIAEQLKTSAIMTGLTREAIGVFQSSCANTIADFKMPEKQTAALQPMQLAVAGITSVVAPSRTLDDLMQGKQVTLPVPVETEEVAVIDEVGRLRSIAVRNELLWKASKNFNIEL